MGRDIAIETTHGLVDGWLAEPAGAPRGALVIIQEIYGLNAHIRQQTERFAAQGYVALAPAIFDVVTHGVELAYDEAGTRRGMEMRNQVGFDRAVAVIAGAAHRLQDNGHKVGAVGYCWGGSLAYLANTRLGLPAVSYYGARTVPFLDEPLRAPMLFHFGGEDTTTPPADIELHRSRHPEAQIHVYPEAGHAFNRDIDGTHYHAASAALALKRTLEFLAEHLQ